MEAVFQKVLELSLYGSILILAILPLRFLLKKAPRWSICLLWALAAIALICPIRLESAISVMPSEITFTETVTAPDLPLVQTEPIMIPDIIESGTQAAVQSSAPNYTAIGTVLWLIGMAVMLTVAAVSYLRLQKQVAVSLLVKDNVYLCDDIDTPFILGILRPRIYLPSALDTTLYPAVLLHEKAHLKRRDHWWKPLGYLLLTVHWFNPLVWLGYTLLCRDIELACDERVIRDMDGQHKRNYSEALLQCSMPRRLITACPLAFCEVGAKQRIKAVLHYKKPAFWVIILALIVCAALAVGFLTKPKVTTLGEMSEVSAEDINSITVNHSSGDIARSVTEIEAACAQLSKLELKQVLFNRPFTFDSYVTLSSNERNKEYFLWFNNDCTLVYLGRNETQDGKEFYIAEAETYKVLNPEIMDIILHSEYLYEVQTTEFLPMYQMQALIEEHLRENNRHFANLEMLGYTLTDANGTTYTMFSMDHLSHDGKVTAKNCLYLAGFTNGRLDGIASGEWAMSAGYYPNLADFNGNLVLWSTRSATHMEVNDDGTLNPNKAVPNEYDSYRIDLDDGTIVWYNDNPHPFIYPLEKGRSIARIAPLDHRGNPVEAFTFTGEQLTVSNVNTISEKSGWDVFLEMNAANGNIDILTSYPTYEGADLFLDMDSSFNGKEPLYAALCNAEQSFPNLKLIGQQSYGHYEYAVIRYDGSKDTVTALVEYTIEGNAVTLLTYAEGYLPDTQGFLTGYCMNCASMEGGIMYWSLYAPRYGVSADGKEVDSTQTVSPDFTHFRFTMRDLETNTFPAAGNFFLCEFTTVIPPAIVTPMEKGKLLAALGSEAPTFTAESYSFVKD